MDANSFRLAKDHIYGLAHVLTKNKEEQEALIDEMREIEMTEYRQGSKNSTIIKELLNPIVDGLFYGNWPGKRP